MSNVTAPPQLLDIESCRRAVFPGSGAPASRTFRQWMAARYFPVHKIGRRVFLDPVEVRRALDRRFKINAVEAQ